MKIYLVGGAVRDKLLGLAQQERDWVVVGTTPEAMVELGFHPVGKDFPVFLHPETKEEYALARTERKEGRGYKGFTVIAAPTVTLEDDLLRRDLTINAIAMDDYGELIDPYGGQADLKAKRLRHVSPAFVEDPVRLLRVARFAARFAHMGFTVAEETLALMSEMVKQGEVDALVPERVWKECERALAEKTPTAFFAVLRKTGALKVLFPELDRLYGVPNPPQHHPEIDTGIHTMMVLEQAALVSPKPEVRFAALMHDLGKGTTPKSEWPKHRGHETRGLKLVKGICQRYKIPKAYSELALLATQYHTHIHKAQELRAGTLLGVLESADAFRRPERFEDLLLTCLADSRGRTGFESVAYPQADIFRQAYEAAKSVTYETVQHLDLTGKAIKEAIHERRVKKIKAIQRRKLD